MDKNRIAQAHSQLSPGLMFRQFTGREEISRMFDWKVELLADQNANMDANAVLGSDMTIELQTKNGGRRWFNGEVTRFAFVGKEVADGTDLWRYEARLRPWMWYMTRQSDFRIFQNMTVPEILDEIFAKYYWFPVEKKLGGGRYRKWEYCVQYQETDFNFVSRLMEHEGIYYFFKHEMSRHTLVLVNDLSKHDPCPGYDTIPYYPADRVAVAPEECIDDWQVEKEVNTGEFATDDYDYKKSGAKLWLTRMKPHNEHLHGDHPVYEWPGGYWDMEDGGNYANLRLEELQASHERVYGQGNARGLAPGYLFTLKTHPRTDQNREYLILGVDYYIRDNPYHTGGEGAADYRFGLTAQPTTNPYRPPRVTPKPLTNGPQTAVVVGKKDEEITTDEYGRVKVLFHWDQYGKKKEGGPDENCSCWVRVSHPIAGNKWGAIFIPRIGQEVIVDFINGDPDYPIIIGRVYNDEHVPPYDLDKYKTYSGIKTHSTMKGSPTDWNELRFVDYKGKEQVFIHANWRMDVRVKWNMYKTVRESYHCQVNKSYYRTVGGDCNLYTKGTLKERVDGEVQASVGGKVSFIADGATSAVINAALSISAPSIVLEAKTKISMKVGGNSVVIDNSGVTIAGTIVKINSGGFGTEATDCDFDDPPYASEADNGEPGYLDRPPKGGGGWKPKHRHAGAYHGGVVPRPGESAAVTAMRQRLAQTPSGRHALDVYDRDGVKTTFIPGKGSSYSGSKFNDNTMNLDPANPGDDNDAGFVHEMHHAEVDHDGTTVFGKEKSTPKADYTNAMLDEEAAGMSKEVQYANEQAAKGTPMSNPPAYQTNYNNNYKKGVDDERARNPDATPEELDAAGKRSGAAAMRKDLVDGTYPTSGNGQTYPDFYNGIHDDDNKPKP